MNATQSKALIAAAQQALALLNPDWSIAQQLKTALMAASVPATAISKAKARKIPKAQYGPHHGDPCELCGKAHIEHIIFGDGKHWEIAKQKDLAAKAREAEQERLSHCTCGHLANRHDEDRDYNLLHCQDCECEQFRSPVIEQQAA